MSSIISKPNKTVTLTALTMIKYFKLDLKAQKPKIRLHKATSVGRLHMSSWTNCHNKVVNYAFHSLSMEILISSDSENRNLRKKTNKLSHDFVKNKNKKRA